MDIKWFFLINQWAMKFTDIFWTSLSLLGNGWSLFALALPLLIFAPRTLFSALISGLFAGICSPIAKAFFDTPRPAAILNQSAIHIVDQPLLHSAMPSGHTMTAFAIATAIFFAAPRQRRPQLMWLFILAAATGLSRIATGSHWPSDVFIGATLGMICGLLGAYTSTLIKVSFFELNQWPSKIILLSSVLCMYFLTSNALDFQMNQPVQYGLAFIIFLTWLMVAKKSLFNRHV
jgi:membrane-associated phospholipid phosphatase